jgi:hypothetical protein
MRRRFDCCGLSYRSVADVTTDPRAIEWLPFEGWVAHVFDHDVRDPAWYFDLDAPFWDAPAPLTIAYITRLFTDPEPWLARFDDATLNQGFWYLVSNGGSNHMFALTDPSAPLADRIACVRSFTALFEKLMMVRCGAELGHNRKTVGNPLNVACYMWWDIIPFFAAPDNPAQRELDAAALGVMAEILALDSVACRESALHGLGHWCSRYPERVHAIIDAALASAREWPNDLLTYARSARGGCVL